MSSLKREVEAITHSYATKGGKTNRRQQRKRMIAFAIFCEQKFKVRHIDNFGKKHVIEYYRSHRKLSDATLYSHYRAIYELFKIAGKSNEPPKPFYAQDTKSKEDNNR